MSEPVSRIVNRGKFQTAPLPHLILSQTGPQQPILSTNLTFALRPFNPYTMFRKSFQTLALIILLTTSTVATAKEASRTVNYIVDGKSAAEVYDFIKRKAPRVAANATFAFTSIATKTDKAERKGKGKCSYSRFKTSAIYGFFIPKHQTPARLPSRTRAKWHGFTAYLQQHEEGHRAIWRACFSDYDAQALKLSAPDCAELDAAREAIFNTIKRACVQQDETYDVQFRKDVVQTPFMREAQERKP